MSRGFAVLLTFFLILTVTTFFVYSCPYHDRLEVVKKQKADLMKILQRHDVSAAKRRRSEAILRQYQREIDRLETFLGIPSSNTEAPDTKHHHSTTSHTSNQPDPIRRPTHSQTNTNPSVSRYTGYNTRGGYFGGSQSNQDRRRVYIGKANTVYRPEEYVGCPNSEYHVCPIGSKCIFEYGTFRCRRIERLTNCRSGLRRVNVSDVQFQCVDVNECDDLAINNCEQVCRNSIGSFRCDCNRGYRLLRNGTCQDNDECASPIHRCQHNCINAVGSYECSCPEGYTLIASRKRCVDIDECLEEDICLENEKCLNTYGGYECNGPEPCETGYTRENVSGSSFGPCVIDTYTDGSSRPVTISQNRFALHSKYPAYTNVGKLHFSKQYGHRYYFSVKKGNTYFSIIQRTYVDYITIRTRRKLIGPGVFEMQILVTDWDGTGRKPYGSSRTTSRVDLSFVVSEYEF